MTTKDILKLRKLRDKAEKALIELSKETHDLTRPLTFTNGGPLPLSFFALTKYRQLCLSLHGMLIDQTPEFEKIIELEKK